MKTINNMRQAHVVRQQQDLSLLLCIKGGGLMANTSLVIKKEMFNDTYLPYLMDYSHRDEIYYGGAGS